MKPLPKQFSFDFLATYHGVLPERIPFLKAVYLENRHCAEILQNKAVALKLTRPEMETVYTYYGAVNAGIAGPLNPHLEITINK
jgi:hypothetical protein